MLSRRRLLAGSAALAGAAALAGVIAVDVLPVARGLPPRGPWQGAMVDAPADEADVPRWRADVDTLADHGLNLVRTGVPSWVVAPALGSWDDDAAGFYRDALDYARHRRLAVNLVLPGAPDWAQSFDFDRYLSACTWFWTSMADGFDDLVILWQAFNEADHSHYQRFTPITLDDQYLQQLRRLLSLAHDVLGRHGTPVTTNLTGWPLDDQRERGWHEVLDALGDSLDVISLDLYPADDAAEITRLPGRIDRTRDRYGKPVFVAEIGLQTTSDSWSAAEQRQLIPAAIEQIRSTDIWGVCLYQLRDQQASGGFGITRLDGSPKPAFADVLRSLG